MHKTIAFPFVFFIIFNRFDTLNPIKLISIIVDFIDPAVKKNADKTEQKSNIIKPIENCVISIDSFIKEDIPEPEYFLTPWLHTGSLSMIFAKMGIGKTWFAMSIAAAVTRGNY